MSSRPDREIQEFNFNALKQIAEYCEENYTDVHVGDVDVVIGGYQKWLSENGFAIIDTKAVDKM